MQLTFYGTGSCTPPPSPQNNPFRSYSGWNIEIDNDSLLFDIGAGVLHKMLLDGKDILRKPTHLFISHYHPDHCSDLIPLMQGRGVYNANEEKLKKLVIGGPPGLTKLVNQVFYKIDSWSSFKKEIGIPGLMELKEVKEGLMVDNPLWKVECAPINHYEESVCYKLSVQGKTIIYSGDMIYDETVSRFGKDADLAILECSYPDRQTLKHNHLCPEDVGRLGKLGNFKKIVLTHLYPPCHGKEEEMIRAVRKMHDVEVIVAYDMLKTEL